MINIEAVAKVTHEANRAFCQTVGDDSQLCWEDAPQWQRDSAIHGVEMHLAAYHQGVVVPAEASHEAWSQEKLAAGWRYGETKDPEAKTHPCLVPFRQLPLAQQQKDYLFGAIVRAFIVCQMRLEP